VTVEFTIGAVVSTVGFTYVIVGGTTEGATADTFVGVI
jgi:hypothetical protein